MKKRMVKIIVAMTMVMTCVFSMFAVQSDAAYIGGASSGRVYFWKYSSGQSYYYTLPNGTNIDWVGGSQYGRTNVRIGNTYGWLTSAYVNYSYSYYAGHRIAGASSGRVYFWKYSSGQSYYYTLPNGTYIDWVGGSQYGRTNVRIGNTYGWLTSAYVY